MPVTGSGAIKTPKSARHRADLNWIVYALFFTLGCITSLNDVIIPKLKALFVLPYVEIMLVQAAFFTAFLLIALPASWVIRKIGYMRTAVAGLLAMSAGCLLFVPASMSGLFPMFLVALFVLASGITVVQVMINPLMAMLGDPATTNSRLSFSQAFYSLGTTISPYAGAVLILGGTASAAPAQLPTAAIGAFRAEQTRVIAHVYAGIAAVVFAVASVVWLRRRRLVEKPAAQVHAVQGFALLKRPYFAYGCASAFVYVGAEIAVGSVVVNYLMQPGVMGLTAQAAGKHLPFYWGGAMLGRFLGGYLLRKIPQGLVLVGAASAAITLLLISASHSGDGSGWALLAVGMCNSVMYPTIFSLACRDLGAHAAEGSGIIVLASVGGAVVPLLTGFTADHLGLKMALLVPALCYAVVLSFGLFVRRHAPSI
ncbi:MAG: sugar MFS transporter [Steroidobacterales bacterium]